jgi:uncharacterized protein (TIGR02300 family)
VPDRVQRAAAGERQRQAGTAAARERGTHARQRLDHAAHGPAAQRGVAREQAGERLAGEDAHQQAGARAGVAEVEHLLGLGEPGLAAALHAPAARAQPLDRHAQRAHRPRRAQHVLALEQALDQGGARGERGEHQRPVRDRLVARQAGGAGERAVGLRPQLHGGGIPVVGRRCARAAGEGTWNAAIAFDRPGRTWQSARRPNLPPCFPGWRSPLAKPEWGTKRTCQSCGARFYDFGRTPAVCPSCGAVFDVEALARARRPSRPSAASRAAAVVDDEPVAGAARLAEADDTEAEELDDAAEVLPDDDEEEEEAVEAEDAADEEDDALIEDASELGEDEDMSDVIEGDVDEEAR